MSAHSSELHWRTASEVCALAVIDNRTSFLNILRSVGVHDCSKSLFFHVFFIQHLIVSSGKGSARITAINSDGQNYLADIVSASVFGDRMFHVMLTLLFAESRRSLGNFWLLCDTRPRTKTLKYLASISLPACHIQSKLSVTSIRMVANFCS